MEDTHPIINIGDWRLETEKYSIQKDKWPGSGKPILAQYNDVAILVYQAYNKEIAEYAVQNQKLGGTYWSSTRMTWIKTNFLWMMFRCGWGQKKNQERILGIWLKRESFEKYITMASTKDHGHKGTVRLQWDPDHFPNGDRHPYRRAIQLGLKNVESFITGEDIVLIQDLTDFVHSQFPALRSKNYETLITPLENVYNFLTIDGSNIKESEKLRVSICYKGKRKAVVLSERTCEELADLVNRKFGMKPKMVTISSSGKDLSEELLDTLPQDSVLNIHA